MSNLNLHKLCKWVWPWPWTCKAQWIERRGWGLRPCNA